VMALRMKFVRSSPWSLRSRSMRFNKSASNARSNLRYIAFTFTVYTPFVRSSRDPCADQRRVNHDWCRMRTLGVCSHRVRGGERRRKREWSWPWKKLESVILRVRIEEYGCEGLLHHPRLRSRHEVGEVDGHKNVPTIHSSCDSTEWVR
jgi:hypothetical protein